MQMYIYSNFPVLNRARLNFHTHFERKNVQYNTTLEYFLFIYFLHSNMPLQSMILALACYYLSLI